MPKALYIVYMTASAGNSVALFCIGDGVVVGVDILGVKYEGEYTDDSQSGELRGSIDFVMPPLTHLITGQSAGFQPQKITYPIALPKDFADREFVKVETPSGPINAKFEKAKEL